MVVKIVTELIYDHVYGGNPWSCFLVKTVLWFYKEWRLSGVFEEICNRLENDVFVWSVTDLISFFRLLSFGNVFTPFAHPDTTLHFYPGLELVLQSTGQFSVSNESGCTFLDCWLKYTLGEHAIAVTPTNTQCCPKSISDAKQKNV